MPAFINSILICFISLFFVFFYSNANAETREIRVSGSDWLDAVFNGLLDEIAEKRGEKIIWNLEGSLPALKSIHADDADIALLALPDGTQGLDPSLKTIPLAYLAVVIVVHRENPIESISEEALNGIYRTSALTPINQWGAFELQGSWASLPLSIHILNEQNPLNYFFKHKCLQNASLKENTRQWENSDALRKHLVDDVVGIAVLPYFKVAPAENLKPLSVIVSENNPSVSPNLENIHNGSYPYSLAFYMVFKPEAMEKLIPYCKALLQESINAQLLAHSLTPLPEKVRQAELLRLDFRR